MKYGYIRYGNTTPEWMGLTWEQRKEKLAKIKKEAEKHGFKLLMWGGPFGVSEGTVCVYESEKSLEDYFAMNEAVPHPMTNPRTNVVLCPFEF
jgi:hypothetical protein